MSSSPIAVLLPHGPTMSVPQVAVAAGEQRGLLAVLATVADPRDPRGIRYPLASMLAVAVCAVLASAVTFAAIADWVRDLDSRLGQARVHRPDPGGVHGVAAVGPRRCRD